MSELVIFSEDDSEDEGESSASEEDGEGSEEESEGEAVGVRGERAWTRLLDNWDASTSCTSCAQTQSWNEL